MARIKILIVDDDSDDRETFCEALKAVAPDSVCYEARNGIIALNAFENNELETPDLIFLDVNMPMMNGWQFLSVIKEKEGLKNIPVIMFSTSSFPEDVQKAHHLGALCFFTKPSDYKDLKTSLALIIEHLVMDLSRIVSKSSRFLICRNEKKI